MNDSLKDRWRLGHVNINYVFWEQGEQGAVGGVVML
jgi:hypothetical protein